jgi:spectinomycin phosphotransferase/16S rRNA (guanine(1405)-N(7))-methyltransferase
VFTRPRDIDDRTLAAGVADGWGIAAASLAYVAVGFGSHHWTVDDADDRRWFLTVDDLEARKRDALESRSAVAQRLRSALTAARHVADLGLGFVVAPIRALDGTVLQPIGERYAAALYPHIDATAYAYGNFRTSDHRDSVLAMLAQLHDLGDAEAAGALTDDLVVPRRDDLCTAIDDLTETWDGGPYGERARRLLDRHAVAVERLFAHYDVGAAAVVARPERMVLTHGEPHPANTLRTSEGWLLIDWDTTLVAAPERDLWHMATDDGTSVAAYERMAGRVVDPQALMTYRLWWDLAEICGYVALLRAAHDDEADVRESWLNLQHYLDPVARWPDLL